MTEDDRESYETDFVSWTQEQAALLRALPRSTGLDIDNLAEEIEAAGRTEISNMSRHFFRVLKGLLMLAADQGSPLRAQWIREISEAQIDVVMAASPGLQRHLNLSRTYKLARRGAVDMLLELKVVVPDFPTTCPLTVEQLLDEDFNISAVIRLMESRDV
ncbi:DUF29 domain-containing protein [Rhizobium sp. NZLR4b]|uniref:DUF29 domain-containing protein n=1 Tax=Rhizobium sp. NZLR4b TaxID=2731102 RepID=UPI001C83A649|nr:DUF29 domain-containing protein [Rhizobium sp. NZLR4b]MBX5164762.1 DUF29 domain-containing protein [Rhizobium sp. NZLR4b]